jgi:hypothetical protein
VSTTTTLTASPNPVSVGAQVTLTATEVAADGTRPAGSVLFEVGHTAIGSPVKVNASGVAIISTAFASAGPEPVSAVFTPAQARFKTSVGTVTLAVSPAPAGSGTIPLAASVPPAGAFTLSVDATDTVTLTVSASGTAATAVTTPITVSDTRNSYPGWSVSGQDATWAGSGTAAGATISGNQLGWTPTSTGSLPHGVVLGPPVTAASPGIGAPAVLASVGSGFRNGYGTTTLGATLTLTIPVNQQAGLYTGSLTISAVAANP